MIARITSVSLISGPTILAAISGVLGWDASKEPFQLPWWQWAGIAVISTLGVLLWGISKRAYRLEKDITPKVKIIFKEGHPFNQYDPSNYDYLGHRTYRVGIKNIGNDVLEHVQVKLIKMNRLSDGNENFNKHLPMNMKRQHDNPSSVLNTPYEQEFSLNPGDTEYVDIVKYEENTRRLTHGDFVLCYALKGHSTPDYGNSVPVDQYELMIKAVADKGEPDQRCFTLSVAEDDELIFIPITEEG